MEAAAKTKKIRPKERRTQRDATTAINRRRRFPLPSFRDETKRIRCKNSILHSASSSSQPCTSKGKKGTKEAPTAALVERSSSETNGRIGDSTTVRLFLSVLFLRLFFVVFVLAIRPAWFPLPFRNLHARYVLLWTAIAAAAIAATTPNMISSYTQ